MSINPLIISYHRNYQYAKSYPDSDGQFFECFSSIKQFNLIDLQEIQNACNSIKFKKNARNLKNCC